MAAWAATSIRNRYPDGYLSWVVETRCSPVVATNGLVDQRIKFPREHWKLNRISTLAEQWAFYAHLRKLKFDWGIDFQGHSKTAICLRLAAPSKRMSAIATDPLARTLNPILAPSLKTEHVVERNHRLICEFADFEIPERPLMPRYESPDLLPKQPITIAVGSGSEEKTWPIERWTQAARILKDKGLPVVLVGGPTDPQVEIPGVVNYVGRLDLASTMAVIANSRLVFAGDTGAGHMAAAYGIDSVSIFGPTDPRVFRPYSSNSLVLKKGQSTMDVTVEEGMSAVYEKLGLAERVQ